MRAQQQIWEECRATGEPATSTEKAKASREAVESSRRVGYRPFPKSPGDMGSDEDAEVDSCAFHRSAAILVP